MRKLIAFFLAVTLLLGTLPVYTVSAEAYSGTCGGEGNASGISWNFDASTGTLTITGAGAMENWYHEMDFAIAGNFGIDVDEYLPADKEYVYTPWYSFREQILHAVVSDGITTLGDFTFSGCTNLLDVTLGKDLTVIGHGSFEHCTSLTELELPPKVTTVGVGAFFYNSALLAITVPEGAKSVMHGAFAFCFELQEVNLPSTLSAMNAFSFAYCRKLTSIEIPEDVPGISGYTFFECTRLAEVRFLGSLRYINQEAFTKCVFLNNLTIPETVTSIHSTAFTGCRRLRNFYVFPGSYGETYCKENFSAEGYTVNAISHEWKVVEIVNPTCGTEGYTLEACSNCSMQRKVDVKEPTGAHLYGSFSVSSMPACDKPGAKVRTCSVCGNVDSVEIPALSHKYKEWTLQEEATCAKEGVETRTCRLCGGVETRYLPKLEHTYTSVVTPPTCTEQGYTTYTCHCGASRVDDYTDVLPHTMGEWTITEEPTEETEGEKYRECTVCGYGETASVPALHHAYGGWTVTKQPTCTESGTRQKKCADCGKIVTESIPPKGHSYEAHVTPATCENGGYTTYICSCSAQYISDYTEILPHAYGEWKVAVPATCTERGEQKRECKSCGRTEYGILPAAGHDYRAVVTPATCEKHGYTTYTCHCNDSYVGDTVLALGHSFGEWSTSAPGVESRTCSSCGKTETRKKTPSYDPDGNGTAEEADVTLLLSILVGNTPSEGVDADFDFDGKLTVYDCVLLMQYLETLQK